MSSNTRGTANRATGGKLSPSSPTAAGGNVYVQADPAAHAIRVYHIDADGGQHGLAEVHPPAHVPLDPGRVTVMVAGSNERGIPIVRVTTPPDWHGAINRRNDVRVSRATDSDPHHYSRARELARVRLEDEERRRDEYRDYQQDKQFQIETFGALLPGTDDVDRLSPAQLRQRRNDPHFRRWRERQRWQDYSDQVRRENLHYQALLGGPESGYSPELARRIYQPRKLRSDLGAPLYDEQTGVLVGYMKTVVEKKELGGAVGTVTRELYDTEGKRLNPKAKGAVALTPAAQVFPELARSIPVLGYLINVTEIGLGESLDLRDRGRQLTGYDVLDRLLTLTPGADDVRGLGELATGVSMSGGADLERAFEGQARVLGRREKFGKAISAFSGAATGAVLGVQARHGPRLGPLERPPATLRRTWAPEDIDVTPVPGPAGRTPATAPARPRNNRGIADSPPPAPPVPPGESLPAPADIDLAPLPEPVRPGPAITSAERLLSDRGIDDIPLGSRHFLPARGKLSVDLMENTRRPRSLSSAAADDGPKPLAARRRRSQPRRPARPVIPPAPAEPHIVGELSDSVLHIPRHSRTHGPQLRAPITGKRTPLAPQALKRIRAIAARMKKLKRSADKIMSGTQSFVRRFANRFYSVPGFDHVMRDFLQGGNMRRGASFVMKFVEENFRESIQVLLQQGKMSFEVARGRLRRMDLVIFNIRYEFKSVQQFRHWSSHRRQLRRDISDLLAQMPSTPGHLKWVFDGDRLATIKHLTPPTDTPRPISAPVKSRRLREKRDYLLAEMERCIDTSFANHPRAGDLKAMLSDIVVVW